jgi:hypothetical protein
MVNEKEQDHVYSLIGDQTSTIVCTVSGEGFYVDAGKWFKHGSGGKSKDLRSCSHFELPGPIRVCDFRNSCENSHKKFYLKLWYTCVCMQAHLDEKNNCSYVLTLMASVKVATDS